MHQSGCQSFIDDAAIQLTILSIEAIHKGRTDVRYDQARGEEAFEGTEKQNAA